MPSPSDSPPDPAFELPAASGAGRLDVLAHRDWQGRSVAIDPESARVAVATDGTVMLGTLPDLGAGRALPLAAVHQIAFVPGRRRLVACGIDGVRVEALDRDATVLRVRTPGPVRAAVSPDGRLVALAGRVSRPRGTVGVWDLSRATRAWTASLPEAVGVAWSGADLLAVGGRGVSLVDARGRAVARLPDDVPGHVTGIAADGGALVCCGPGPRALRLDLDDPTVAEALPVPAAPGRRDLMLSGTTLAAGSPLAGGAVALVDVVSGRVDRVILGVRAAALAGDLVVVTGAAGTSVLRWSPGSAGP